MIPKKEFTNLTPKVTVYSYHNTIFMIPHVQCHRRKHQAESIQMLPITSIEEFGSAEEIGNTALHAFEHCVLLGDAPSDKQRFNPEAWRREQGFETYRDFLRQATYVVLIRRAEIYEILPSKRSHDAFQWLRDELLQVPLATSPKFLGEQIMKALVLSDVVNPLIPKYRNPHPGEYPDALSLQVIGQIQRLGGKLPDTPPTGEEVLNNVVVPKALEMLANVQWPSKKYQGDYYDSLWMVDFGFFEEVEELDKMQIVGIEDRALVHIAFTDGGNYFLVLDLYDPNPSDPIVYQLDHDCPGQSLRLEVPLSEILSDLEEDDGEND